VLLFYSANFHACFFCLIVKFIILSLSFQNFFNHESQ